MPFKDAELEDILAKAMGARERISRARTIHSLNAQRERNRQEFERRFRSRIGETMHSVRVALNDEPLDAARFRHWFLYMRFHDLKDLSICEWRKMIDLDILNKEELKGG